MFNEDLYLEKFLSHYRRLGVTRFFFIDDNSTIPLETLDLGDDVEILRPKVGTFRTAKTLWLEGVMKACLADGAWAMTIDADEFLNVPVPYHNLRDFIAGLKDAGRDFAPGILLDMLPAPGTSLSSLEKANERFDSMFDHFCFRNTLPSEEYISHRSIKWGFGPYAQISWRSDTRYHAFGTFDSLRKLPLFRYRKNRHLNQGFHTFHYIDGTKSPGNDIWDGTTILPIFHYKLVKMFSSEKSEEMISMASGYHSRTKDNILKIFSDDYRAKIDPFSSMSLDLLPAQAALTMNRFKMASVSEV
jgi:hypothetical protein